MNEIKSLIPAMESLSQSQLKELQELGLAAVEELRKRLDKDYVNNIPDYDSEVKKSFDEGFKTGLTWRDGWKHRPGGPWVYSASNNDNPHWRQQARLSKDKNKAWLSGWEAGIKQKQIDKTK